MIQSTPHVPRALSRYSGLRMLGPVVYALRLDDGIIKIGFTTDLADRERTVRRQGKSDSSELLAFMTGGTYEDEQAIHARLVEHIAHGREYYHPTKAVLAEVNRMREALSLAPLG